MTDTDARVGTPSPDQGSVAYRYLTAQSGDWDDVVALQSEAFHEEIGQEWSANHRLVAEPGRTVLVRPPSGLPAGTGSAYTRDLVVPGGTVPAAHLTMVAVSAVHRRRGILRQMISLLHQDAARRGEPVAVLCASEGRIYQRFGYGLAATRLVMDFDTRDVSLRAAAAPTGDGGRIRQGAPADLDPLVQVFERAQR